MSDSKIDAQIFVMTKITSLVRDLPEEIFSNIEIKQNIQVAATEHLDNLIAQENEEEMSESADIGASGFGILGDIGLDEITTELQESGSTEDVEPGSDDFSSRSNLTVRGNES